jgi:hypothetical protein
MNWQEIEKFESNKDWTPAIKLLQTIVIDEPDNIEAYVRLIYLLHNILLEEKYHISEHDYFSNMLKYYFEESNKKFLSDSEYLFFIGKILYIAEWYFGIDDDSKPMVDRLAFKMQKGAFDKEPDNILYEWAYVFSKGEKTTAYALSKKLLFENKKSVNWLNTKGFPGKYLLESIITCNENYK